MKTYPFVRVLINLYWLVLLIVIGFLTITISAAFFSEKPDEEIAAICVSEPLIATTSPALTTSIKTGKKLFMINCATCHNKNMKSDMTGPALAGVRERWSDYPAQDLYAWIKNSTKLIEAEHPKAVAVYTNWDKVTMPAFHNMTEEEVIAILDYVDTVK